MAPAKYGREGSVFGGFLTVTGLVGFVVCFGDGWDLEPHTHQAQGPLYLVGECFKLSYTLPCRNTAFSSLTITPRHIQRLLLRLGPIVSFTLKTPLSRLGAEERAQWLRAPFLAEVLCSVPSIHPARVSPWRQARPWRHT